MKRLCSLFALVALAWASPTAWADFAISITGVNGGFKDGVPRVIGWEFTTGSTAITVSQLGVYDDSKDGLQSAHDVAIYDYLTEKAVVSGTVPSGTTGTLSGFFRYVSVSDTTLAANTKFVIAASWPKNLDEFVWSPGISSVTADITGLSVDSAITLGLAGTGLPTEARYEDTTSTLQFPTKRIGDEFTGDPRELFVGPDFTFTPVPEPSSLLLIVLGTLFFCGYRWRCRKAQIA